MKWNTAPLETNDHALAVFAKLCGRREFHVRHQGGR
jgi:hypothetical protein